jgi:hemerythrin
MKIELIVWNREYSLDVPGIDIQHREIMTLINHTISHCTGNPVEEKNYFDKVINTTIQYLSDHFETEERILSKTKYENYEEHKKEHDAFLKKVKVIREDVQEGKKKLNLFEFAVYFKEWVLSHILSYDKRAEKYFKKFFEDMEKTTAQTR